MDEANLSESSVALQHSLSSGENGLQIAPARRTRKYKQPSIADVKVACQGLIKNVLVDVGGYPIDALDGEHHGCPLCKQGKDCFRLIDPEAGAVLCNKCFRKGCGDVVAAVAKSRGCKHGQAAALIADYLGLDPRKKYPTPSPLSDSVERRSDNHSLAAALADADTLNRVYSALLNGLVLSDAHRAALRERGLSDQQIDKSRYRTWGKPSDTGTARLMAISAAGADAARVPGFRGGRFFCPNGMIVPICDVESRIIALKPRRDASEGNRYVYVSSKGHGGPSPGDPCHVPIGVQGPIERIRVCEGPLKADVATHLSGMPTLGFPSAGNYKVLLPVLRSLDVKVVVLAFDADATTNVSVAEHLLGAVQLLTAEGFVVEVETWPLEDGKGIDDLYQKGKSPTIHTGDDAIKTAKQTQSQARGVSNATEGRDAKESTSDDELPEVVLPGGGKTITGSACELGKLLSAANTHFLFGGAPSRLLHNKDEPMLKAIDPGALCSDFEAVAKLLAIRETDSGIRFVPTICSKSTAEQILKSATFANELPPIQLISRCSVLTERDGSLAQISGYDRVSGIWSIGTPVPDISIEEAKARLTELLADFNFASAGDLSRAHAALITPALVMGGLLGGRAPIDLGEADQSQTGKGFRNKLTAAIYSAAMKTVAQNPAGGVGSLKESFDSYLVAGANLISFDNISGKLNLTSLESFMTEDSYLARVPYRPAIEIDPRRVIVMLTANKAEATKDLANRASVVRMLKQPDSHRFASFKEGDILDHILAQPEYYLAAVFSVIHEWHRRGKPVISEANHDFRRWARVLGYMVEHILGLGRLMDGHREVQSRIASTSLSWLRDVAFAVHSSQQNDQWLRANQILRIVDAANIATDGIPVDADLDDHDAWTKASRAVGRNLAKCFTGNSLTIDTTIIERHTGRDDGGRDKTEYRFSRRATVKSDSSGQIVAVPPMLPNTAPNQSPNQNADFPNPPNELYTSNPACAHAHAHEELPEGLGGLGTGSLLREFAKYANSPDSLEYGEV